MSKKIVNQLWLKDFDLQKLCSPVFPSLPCSHFCLITQSSSPSNDCSYSNHISILIWTKHRYGSIFWNCFMPNNPFACHPIIACILLCQEWCNLSPWKLFLHLSCHIHWLLFWIKRGCKGDYVFPCLFLSSALKNDLNIFKVVSSLNG